MHYFKKSTILRQIRKLKSIFWDIGTTDQIQTFNIIKNKSNCRCFRYTKEKFCFAKIYTMSLVLVSVLLVFTQIIIIPNGIANKKLGQCGKSFANIINISGTKVIYDYINSYSSNILCNIPIFNAIKSLLIDIAMYFYSICKQFATTCMQNQRLHQNEFYFIQYYTINNL
eukprot:234818_1